jgi:hypothetical protein
MIASVTVCVLLISGTLYFLFLQGVVVGSLIAATYVCASFLFCEYCRLVGGVLRESWLARFLGGAINVVFTDESRATLAALDTKRQIAFAVDPHGPAALAMSWAFAAHAGQLPREIADNTLVMAHAAHTLVPFVRELFATAGVISHTRASVDEALAGGWNIAFAPSGIDGWLYSHIVEPERQQPTVYVRRARRQRGMFRRVYERGMLLVPVLSIKEDTAYTPVFQFGEDFNALYVGRFLVLPVCPVIPVRVGKPLDARKFADIDSLIDAYYAALRELGNETEVDISQ